MSTTSAAEIIDHSDTLCSSVVKIWVLLEGTQSPLKLKADITSDLDDFKEILKCKYEELTNVKPQHIVFLDSNNKQLLPDADIRTISNTATAKNPLVVRYPLSDLSSK